MPDVKNWTPSLHGRQDPRLFEVTRKNPIRFSSLRGFRNFPARNQVHLDLTVVFLRLCQGCGKNTACPVPGDCTGLLFLSKLQSPIHCTHTCPCFHQGNKVRDRNTGYVPAYLLFVRPLGSSVPNTDGKQQAAVALWGDAPLFYLQKRFLISGSIQYCIEVLAAWWAGLGQLPGTHPASLCPPQLHRGRNHNKKAHGSR